MTIANYEAQHGAPVAQPEEVGSEAAPSSNISRSSEISTQTNNNYPAADPHPALPSCNQQDWSTSDALPSCNQQDWSICYEPASFQQQLVGQLQPGSFTNSSQPN